MNFHLLIAQGVCYLTLCEASFPRKMAFEYLEDLRKEFYDQYGKKVPTVTNSYSFKEFDLDKKVSNLTSFSKKYRNDANDVDTSPGYAKAAAVAVFITLIIYMRFWWP